MLLVVYYFKLILNIFFLVIAREERTRRTAIRVSVKIGSMDVLTDNASSRPGNVTEIR